MVFSGGPCILPCTNINIPLPMNPFPSPISLWFLSIVGLICQLFQIPTSHLHYLIFHGAPNKTFRWIIIDWNRNERNAERTPAAQVGREFTWLIRTVYVHTQTGLDKHVTLNKIFLSSHSFHSKKKEFEIICREGLKSYHIQNMQFDIYANTSLILPFSVG